jgi:hypothetical protein
MPVLFFLARQIRPFGLLTGSPRAFAMVGIQRSSPIK